MIEEAHWRSLELLDRCVTPAGFVASPAFDHYAAIWARDACITGLGALASGDAKLVGACAATLDTLAATASPLGQIAARVDRGAGQWDWGEGGAVDPSAWFVVLAGRYLDVTGDTERVRSWWPAVSAAVRWLTHQDVTGSGLISAAPSTDWMDAALTRAGRTLNLNVLYAWAASSAVAIARRIDVEPPAAPTDLRDRINNWFWPDPALDLSVLYPHGFAHQALRVAYWEAGSYRRRHYVSHIVHAAIVDRCDVLANLLAIAAGVAGCERSTTILDHVWEHSLPFPSPSLTEPVPPTDPAGMLISAAEANIPPRWRNPPGRYHNGAVWPFIGGFHVVAEAKTGRHQQAEPMLERLAEANSLGGWAFPEWIGPAGEPAGAPGQAWNAGAFLMAYRAVSESR